MLPGLALLWLPQPTFRFLLCVSAFSTILSINPQTAHPSPLPLLIFLATIVFSLVNSHDYA